MALPPTNRPRSGFYLCLVLLGAPLLYLLGNDRVPLWDRDEPRYAQCSREMLRSGDWVVPHLYGEWRAEKPPLIYWAQAAAMGVLGETAFAARLPSVLAMTALLLLLAALIRRTIGSARALWTVLILATTAATLWATKTCLTDAVQLLFITTAEVCLLAIYQGNRRRLVAAAMWIAIALAGLTKGPMVLAVLLTTMLALAVMDWPSQRRQAISWWRHTRPIMGLGILALVVGPWLMLAHRRAPGFLEQLFLSGARHVGTSTNAHTGPPGYHLVAIWGAFFPWSLLLPAAVILAWRHRRLPVVRFSLAAVIGPWIFVELMRTKLPSYLLPAYPALAFLCADALVRCARGQYQLLTRASALIGTAIWSLAALALAALPWLILPRLAPPPLPKTAAYAMVALTLVAGTWAVVVYFFFRSRCVLRAAAAMGIGMALFTAILCAAWLPEIPALRLSQRIAEVLRDQGATRSGDAVMIGYEEPSLAFYQGGTIREAAHDAYLAETPSDQWARDIVITDDIWRRMPASVRAEAEVIASFHGLDIGDGQGVEVLVVKKK